MYNFNMIFNFSRKVFCDVMSCIFVHGYHRLKENYSLHLHSSLWLKPEISSVF